MVSTILISQCWHVPTTSVNPDKVNLFAKKILDGYAFPPIIVTPQGTGKYLVIGGCHRLLAHKQLGRKTIQAHIA